MKTRDQRHRRYLQTRYPIDWENFKESQNFVKQILRDAERKYTLEGVQMHKHISSSLWKVINRTIPSKDKDKLIYTRNHKTVANGFNNFFTSVGRNASESAAQLAEEHNIVMTEQEGPPLTIPTSELFNFRAVTCEDVQRIIHVTFCRFCTKLGP